MLLAGTDPTLFDKKSKASPPGKLFYASKTSPWVKPSLGLHFSEKLKLADWLRVSLR
jgi:hypothetical protein